MSGGELMGNNYGKLRRGSKGGEGRLNRRNMGRSGVSDGK